MGTRAEPLDPHKLRSALADVRSDQGEIYRKSWVIVGHVDQNPQSIDVSATSEITDSSLGTFCSYLKNDEVMYCLLRMTTTFDMSNTVKFVYIHWIGEHVPFAKKGRYGVVSGSVEEYFTPYHLLIETGSLDDLTEENIIKKLEESSGTRNKVIEGSTAGRQERGFTAHSLKPQARTEPRSVAPAGINVEVSPEFIEAINDVRRDDTQTAWVLTGFQNGDIKKPLEVLATGVSDLNEMKGYLQDDQVQFALFRTSDVYDSIQTVKFVYIYWIGEKVKPMTKGKLSAYAGPIEKLFSPAHVTMMFSHKNDIQDHIIKDKLTMPRQLMNVARCYKKKPSDSRTADSPKTLSWTRSGHVLRAGVRHSNHSHIFKNILFHNKMKIGSTNWIKDRHSYNPHYSYKRTVHFNNKNRAQTNYLESKKWVIAKSEVMDGLSLVTRCQLINRSKEQMITVPNTLASFIDSFR
ncbi:hypothetical protein HELRODRAFT_194138 [Helobdella robusta]|uniref:Coactosin-like protein n=1 Tax=Helobdella robusta TaxID=6412 RepID=T1FVQ9_HELRO|nr:hypothetical protein HELRODRAFT_194138 [Helobdella robusta]ESN93342.1 hypothetical protein HELRODRAFT_194138 [Helobdella robusta]